MATIESGTQPSVSAEVEPTFKALRVTQRPIEYVGYGGGGQQRALGHYSIGVAAPAAITPVASAGVIAFRHADPTCLMVLLRLYININVITAVTAQRLDQMSTVVQRGFTTFYVTNTTLVTPLSGDTNKTRTIMGSSSLLSHGNIGYANAAAGLSGGTGVGDAGALTSASISGMGIGLGQGLANLDLYKWDRLGGHPPVFAANEGLVVFWGTTTLATGSITIGFGLEWAEVPEF
jgi:hypothetical protein